MRRGTQRVGEYPMRTAGLNLVREKSARRQLQLMLLGRTCTCVGKLFLSCESAIKVLVMFAVPAPDGTALLIASSSAASAGPNFLSESEK